MVDVTLQRERIRARRRVVRAKPSTLGLPAVIRSTTVGVLRGTPIEVFSINSVGSVPADFVAIASSHCATFFVAAACGHDTALRSFGFLGDDVNYAVHSIRSPQRCSGSTNDFNAVDILEHYVLYVPINAREERRVYASAVDAYQKFVVKASVEAARTDGPFVFVNARHFQTWDESQRLGNAGGARASQIFLGDHEDRGSGVRDLLRALRDGGHLNVHQVFHTQSGNVRHALLALGSAVRCQKDGHETRKHGSP